MVHGLLADGYLSDKEISALDEWMSNNDYLAGTYPYDEIESLLVAARQDGKISEDERNMLTAFS